MYSKKKGRKETVFNRLKLRQCFFMYTYDLQAHNFFNKVIPSDLRNTTRINIFNSDDSNIAYTKTHIDKSLQPLYTEY